MDTKPAPVPVGTMVKYHGSIAYKHGLYYVERHEHPRPSVAEHYSDGVAYDLHPDPEGPRRLGDSKGLWNVRRGSFTVVTEPGVEVDDA